LVSQRKGIAMRKRFLLCFLGWICSLTCGWAAPVNKPVTVRELERVLEQASKRPDKEAARELSGLALCERLNGSRLSHWETVLPGRRSRQALITLADVSAFLDLPPEEIPPEAAPDIAEQRRIVALMVAYVNKTVHQLPNLFATRVTESFEDRPGFLRTERPANVFVQHLPFFPAGSDRMNVQYRDGAERKVSGRMEESTVLGLTTRGEFGPILELVLSDTKHTGVRWSHWEPGISGHLAVFCFSVPVGESHYRVYRNVAGYRAEVAVDPADGTVHRFSVLADLKATDSIKEADIVVEYGQVALGGSTYWCPVKSVALSMSLEGSGTFSGTQVRTRVNDVAFVGYRRLGSEAKVLTGEETGPG
jgi:hypothetical protein